MNIATNAARKAICDKFAARLHTVEAKLDTLRAQAETTKANVEIKTITELAARKHMLEQRLQVMKRSEDAKWEQAKADLESQITEMLTSLGQVESRLKAMRTKHAST